MRETKNIPASQIKINQKFYSYNLNSIITIPWRHYIKEINDNEIIIYDKFSNNDPGEKIPKNVIFQVELTEKEFNQKYHEAARAIYEKLSCSEYLGEHGSHEMYNAWIGNSIQEFYINLKKKIGL